MCVYFDNEDLVFLFGINLECVVFYMWMIVVVLVMVVGVFYGFDKIFKLFVFF